MKKAYEYFLIAGTIFAFFILNIFYKTITVSAWGDNSGLPDMRPSYTKAEIDAGKLGDKITFNSISDNDPYGDEKNFMSARMYNDTDLSHPWRKNEIEVEDGKEYVIRMYVHNNSPKGRDGVAKDTRAYFQVPDTSAKEVKVRGYINSSNATPTKYFDDIVFKSNTAFHLEFVGGSALIKNDGVGKAEGGAKLDDALVTNTNGVLIGFDSLNGEIPGCFEYDSFITARVKAYYDTNFTVKTKVRLANNSDKGWKEEVEAKIGDHVEFQINYTNISNDIQHNVTIDDQLPNGLEYIPDTLKIYNGSYPKGVFVDCDEITKSEVHIGSYSPNSNALIRFRAIVVKDESFIFGKFILKNWGRASIGSKVVQDSASVVVEIHEKNTTEYQIASYIFFMLFVLSTIVIIVLKYIQFKLKNIR